MTLTPRQWIDRIRTAIRNVEDLLVSGRDTLLGEELVELRRLRDELKARLSKLEQRPWPSARWHAADPDQDPRLAVLLARIERHETPR